MERVPQSAPLHDNDTASQDRTLGGHSRSSAGLEEKKARSSLDALDSGTAVFSDRDLILRLKQTARDDSKIEASSELEHFQAGASPSRTRFKDFDGGRQRAIQTGQPQTVSTIIDVSQYDGFKKELASLGKIESEMPAPANEIDARTVRRMARIFLVLALLFGLVACGNDDAALGADPAGADDDLINSIEAYARTQIEGDPEALVQARSAGCAELDTDLDAGEVENEGLDDDIAVTDVEAEVEDDEATVSYRLDPGGEKVTDERWVREDGEWKWDNC